MLDNRRNGALGIFWKFARVGERLSPYVAVCCVVMAVSVSLVLRLLGCGAQVVGDWGVSQG